MNKIFFCQTPFQIISAIFIAKQYKREEDRFDIVIVDMFSNYRSIADKINNTHIFNNVYVAEASCVILAKNITGNIKKLFYTLFPGVMVNKFIPGVADFYDEMFIWNYDAFTATFRSFFSYSKKTSIKVNIYDEGWIVYLPIDDVIPKKGFMKLIEMLNKFKGKGFATRENINSYYLYEPEAIMFDTNASVYAIDRELIKRKDIIDTLDYIFDSKEEAKKYDKKYIILEEAILANVPNVHDEEIFDKIVEIVGKDNVLIKLHPRTKEDRFTKKGIKTLGQSGVPFEAIALCSDFAEKTLIGISCGTIPTYRMLFGSDINAYMLFKYMKPDVPWLKDEYSYFWDRIASTNEKSGIRFPHSEEDFLKKLKEEVGCE